MINDGPSSELVATRRPVSRLFPKPAGDRSTVMQLLTARGEIRSRRRRSSSVRFTKSASRSSTITPSYCALTALSLHDLGNRWPAENCAAVAFAFAQRAHNTKLLPRRLGSTARKHARPTVIPTSRARVDQPYPLVQSRDEETRRSRACKAGSSRCSRDRAGVERF